MPRTRSRVLSAARATASCFDCLADGAGRVADLLLQRLEVRGDVVFHAARVLRAGALQRALGVADLLADALVADAAGRLVELARRVLLVAAHLVGDLLELLLQVGDLGVHRVLALAERLRLGLAARAGFRLIERVDVRRDFLLLVGELLGLALRALQIALAAAALVPFELLLRLDAADRAPGSPARRRPSIRSPRRGASRRPRPAAASSRRPAAGAAAGCASAVRAAAPPSRPRRRARAARRSSRPTPLWPDCAIRRCRSISCCCRRASSFSFSTS